MPTSISPFTQESVLPKVFYIIPYSRGQLIKEVIFQIQHALLYWEWTNLDKESVLIRDAEGDSDYPYAYGGTYVPPNIN